MEGNGIMDDIMLQFEPLIEHVKENAIAYGIGAVVVLIVIYFTRPYSTAIIFYALEISTYLLIMHAVVHVIVYLLAAFSNATTMRNVFDGEARGEAVWTTPWRFWEREVYDPQWIMWAELVVAILIVAIVWYYRPMKVQTNRQGHMTPEAAKPKPKTKSKKGEYDDDDDWGVATTRRYTMPEDFGKNDPKKK